MHRPNRHIGIGRVLAGISLFLLMASLLPAKPQKDDEDPKAKTKKSIPDDEEPKNKTKKSIPSDDDPRPVKPIPKDNGTKPPPRNDDEKIDLAAEAAKATHSAVKKLFADLTFPYDVLHHRTRGELNAAPLSIFVGDRPNSGKVPYTPMPIPGKKDKISTEAGTGELLEARHFEIVAVNKVDAFLSDGLQWMNLSKSDGNYISRLDQLVAADKALTFALKFHDAAKTELKRQGAGWESLRGTLASRLLEVLETELAVLDAASASEAPLRQQAAALAFRIGDSFFESPRAQRSVLLYQLNQASNNLMERDDIYIKGAESLRNLEKRFAKDDPKIFDAVRDKLRYRSKLHLDEAKKLVANPDNTFLAQRQIEWCEAIDPAVEGLLELKAKINRDYRVLVVGVRQLPERMSPALALTDADRWAIELIFESLIKPVPDPEVGQRYRPELAIRSPKLIPMGREFQLIPNATWALREGDGERITADTIKNTITHLQRNPNLAVAEQANLLRPPNVTDQLKFQLLMDRGYLEPLAAMSFKILPTQLLDKMKDGILDEEFAKNPVGSGPYIYFGRRTEDGKEFAVFKANKSFASRPGKSAPKIQEIRFVVSPADPAPDLHDGKLDVVLDIPTADMVRLRAPDLRLASVVKEQTLPTRRIWMLAVNHRWPELGGETGKNLRRAISHAIDREEILKTFRAGTVNSHRALNGPFPPDVWATPSGGQATPLFRAEYAQSMYKLAKKPDRVIKLAFVDDPLSRKACEAIKKQIGQNGIDLNIELVPMTAATLHQAVMIDHNFDLAYMPFDYNDVYSLTGLFDVNATGRGERNFMGYTPDPSNTGRWLAAIRGTRSFYEVQKNSHLLHGAFNENMPFVPLWQLDFHMILSQKLEVHPLREYLDPLTIFDESDTWRLNR